MATTAPRLISPLERTSSALNEARELSARVRNIVDTLIGSCPENTMKNEGICGGSGLVTGLADNADDAASHIRQAQDDLSRLSKVLGLGL
ncbi:hypothetical protein [Agrobacterium rubi]|uniref:Uncharacterized protein n=1 Tax=Agrobacterium rubi TaxID=28099 RepID=A0ABX2J2Q1_9HYPH|nr:hypothetical protein [Agrobacterium rubi]NTF35551.1 hypothetical protein [Agrobacterium rubi]